MVGARHAMVALAACGLLVGGSSLTATAEQAGSSQEMVPSKAEPRVRGRSGLGADRMRARRAGQPAGDVAASEAEEVRSAIGPVEAPPATAAPAPPPAAAGPEPPPAVAPPAPPPAAAGSEPPPAVAAPAPAVVTAPAPSTERAATPAPAPTVTAPPPVTRRPGLSRDAPVTAPRVGVVGGGGASTGPSPAATPEPSTLLLMGTGLAGLYRLLRRR